MSDGCILDQMKLTNMSQVIEELKEWKIRHLFSLGNVQAEEEAKK